MALLVLVVVAGLAALFLIPGSTPRMDIRRYPNRLAILDQVPVKDTRQWILVRSESATNPVVLFVHDFALLSDLARRFTRTGSCSLGTPGEALLE